VKTKVPTAIANTTELKTELLHAEFDTSVAELFAVAAFVSDPEMVTSSVGVMGVGS